MNNDNIVMACGHTANAVNSKKEPICYICNCSTIAYKKYDLKGRKAKCPYCKKIVESNYNLPMFKYNKDCEFDEFYDGCFGWD